MNQERWIATNGLGVGVLALAMAGAAHAQSSVTLYGAVDTGLLFTNKSLNASTGRNAGTEFSLVDSADSVSMFGLSSEEDVGNGVKAKFKLESGFSMTNGAFNDSNGNFFGRQAWIGLSNGLGEFKAGLQFSPFLLSLYELDPRGLSQFGSSIVNYVDNVLATGIFNANAVSYSSPVFAGLQGSVMFAFGGEAGNFSAGRQYSASQARYFLSKRTTVYGQVGVVNNHGAMNTGLSIDGALNGVTGTTVGANVGLNHHF
ncbi:porin [Trinickia sp. EG282A]|uniref:porin n=1 Tax=Trinickia sp. EG282A TaxID=3237013 RepID=UPI0034D1DF65